MREAPGSGLGPRKLLQLAVVWAVAACADGVSTPTPLGVNERASQEATRSDTAIAAPSMTAVAEVEPASKAPPRVQPADSAEHSSGPALGHGRKGSMDSVVFYSNRGTRKKALRGDETSQVAQGQSEIMPSALTPDSIAQLQRALDRSVVLSKRQPSSVAITKQILHAMAAPTATEFGRRIAELPVTRTVSSVPNQGGTKLRANYYVHGVLKVSVFGSPGESAGHRGSGDAAEGNEELGSFDSERPGGPSLDAAWANGHSPSAMALCTDQDFYDNWVTGECITERELNQAWTIAAAAEYEAEAHEADFNAAKASYCGKIPSDAEVCQYEQEENALAANLSAATYAFNDGYGEYGESNLRLSGPCASEEMLFGAARETCVEEYIGGLVAIGSWFAGHSRMVRALSKGMSGVGAATLGSTLGYAAVVVAGGLAVGAMIHCAM